MASPEEIAKWLDDILPKHERLTGVALALFRNLLQPHAADILEITGRTKDRDKVLEKISRKNYKNPMIEVTDLSGIRVTTYFENSIAPVCALVRKVFNIIEIDSVDQSIALGVDRIGYRSMHFVCNLGTNRETLPEYAGLANLPFEIQIRTVLQHAWAELSHDRAYKFRGKLRDDLQRRVNLCSGMLEMIDREFVSIVKDIDEYEDLVKSQTTSETLELSLDSISITKFLDDTQKNKKITLEDTGNINSAIAELQTFGINLISELDILMTDEFIEYCKSLGKAYLSKIGLLRLIMLYSDIDKYISLGLFIWKQVPTKYWSVLVNKYGKHKMDAIAKQFGVSISGQ